MKIDYLADYPEHCETVARWNFDEWAYLYENSSYEGFLRGTKANLGKQQIPSTLIAVESNLAIGSASLLLEENKDRKDLSPWLSSMYVSPQFRGNGVGRALNERVIELARELGFTVIYLEAFEQHLDFYSKLGWQSIEKIIYKNQKATIMSVDTSSQRANGGNVAITDIDSANRLDL